MRLPFFALLIGGMLFETGILIFEAFGTTFSASCDIAALRSKIMTMGRIFPPRAGQSR